MTKEDKCDGKCTLKDKAIIAVKDNG